MPSYARSGLNYDGQPASGANMNRLPQGLVGWSRIGSNITVPSGGDVTIHSLSVPMAAGRRYRITWAGGDITHTAAVGMQYRMYVNGILIKNRTESYATGGALTFYSVPPIISIHDQTTAATVVVQVQLQMIGSPGNSTYVLSGTSTNDDLMVEDVGPTFYSAA